MSSARSPPARPHIGINPSHFSTRSSTADWGEDDAWDSTSDSESPRQSTLAHPWRPPASTSSTAPKPVLKPAHKSSTSTLASSYTHLNAPNPSSYPPRPEEIKGPQNGWTIVTKSHDHRRSESVDRNRLPKSEDSESQGDVDVEGDMILGEFDLESVQDLPSSLSHSKPKKDRGRIREDIDDIVNGMLKKCGYNLRISLAEDPLHGVRQRSRRPDHSPGPRKVKELPDPDNPEKSEKLMRERSIRTNRRHKFVDCLSSQDVNIGQSPQCIHYSVFLMIFAAELRKLSWAGIPGDLRPMAWQLLLVCLSLCEI